MLGLNPHCESKLKYNEEINVIIPAIKTLKKKKLILQGLTLQIPFF